MSIELITTRARLEEISAAWDDLWRRAPSATPFQSPHWLLPWWDAFGTDTPHVVASWKGEQLDALAPLYILRDDDTGESLGMLLGSGISDYLDVLAVDLRSLDAVVRELASADCQMWDFQQLRPASLLGALDTPAGWSASVDEQDRCPVLSIGGASEDLAPLLSTHARKKIRYYRRALERDAPLAITSATAESLDTMLESLFELHAARWQKRGLPGVLADEVTRDFHRNAARRMLAAGALRMFAMQAGEKTIAVFYGFAHHGTVYYYLSGYDPAYEKFSIGNLIVAHAIGKAIREGAQTFDFLRGAEEYKYAWGAVDRVNRHVVWIRESTEY